ncbi:sulfatase/phosphatase domain-containing protein, partial [Paracoccus sp. (in: a-proteobacteria)]|uniref:sulfatase/phosphatase domain-containing protein n=1 Tax=Paracoccus sp. TaxID=267 RepID=UPI003A88DC0A
VIYTSDHGDNAGARGLWGKSNMYEESVAIPMIAVGPDFPQKVCETPVNLIDLSATITDHFGVGLNSPAAVKSLRSISNDPDQPDRIAFSEYHAAGAVSGAFMIRQGRWKYIHYVGFLPELFDLQNDPEETRNLACEPEHAETLSRMRKRLREICDPERTDAEAFADQDALIARFGGVQAASRIGAAAAEPIPTMTDPG